jgi:N-acyl-L-homoserine lactone synthetase
MQATTLSFANMHNHGVLMANMFRARREAFIEHNKWELPEADGMEFDQYDTPASRWIAIHEPNGEVLAGVRLTPTTAHCGVYTYMIRDAQRGLLETIPSTLLYDEAPVAPNVWESSRIFVSHRVPTSQRITVRVNLINELTSSARMMGATRIIGLVRQNVPRWARRMGLDIQPAGPVMDIEGMRSQCININLAAKLH